MKLNKTHLVIVSFEVKRGRTYRHTDGTAVCLTCAGEPVYGSTCETAGHAVRRDLQTTVQEDAPVEAKAVSEIYNRAHREIRAVGYDCGRAVYLIGDSERGKLDTVIAKLRGEIVVLNATLNVCRVALDLKIVEILPGTAHEETLRSIRHDVQTAAERITDALAGASAANSKESLAALREVVRETRGLAGLLDGESKSQIDDLTVFAARTADRLRAAVRVSENAVAEVVNDSRAGAARFARIFAAQATPAPTPAPTPTPGVS